MSELARYFNRELSWLEFNQRVLDEARDVDVPLVERVKFLAIAGSNLDEFFRVRVGALVRMVSEDNRAVDPAGLTAIEQLTLVRERASQMMAESDAAYAELERSLAAEKWPRVALSNASEGVYRYLNRVFEQEVYPVLTPLAVDPASSGLQTSAASRLPGEIVTLAVQLRANELFGGDARWAFVPLASPIRRIFSTDEGYVLLEDLVRENMNRLFVGETISEVGVIRITRDADITLEDDETVDLISEMEDVLDARKRGRVVRLEVEAAISEQFAESLMRQFDVDSDVLVRSNAPLGLSAWFGLVPKDRLLDHRDPHWPATTPEWAEEPDLFSIIADRDRVLVHPYETFDPVVSFLEQAAVDPDVIAIKQTIYRTAKDSRIVDALIRAATAGKHVAVLVELKARFDEARNIDRARELEEAGIFVTYGVRGLKTHAKLSLVVRREPQGTTRYVHLGTGNYNEATAKLYGDVSLFTSDPDIGADAVSVFNAITGFSQPHSLRKLQWAPINLRDRVVELIAAETERAHQGQQAWIRIKLNSLVDPELIDALYSASSAGVAIEINVRGICCLRPGVPGLSEGIRVVRLVDRFLEHARILAFANGGEPRVFISSADWMPRNLDRRIEMFVPVEDRKAKDRLLQVLDACLSDTAKATRVDSDGRQNRIRPRDGQDALRAQEQLWRDATEKEAAAERHARTNFIPHESQRN